MNKVRIVEKPDNISCQDIHNLLNRAHQSNIKEGLVYATANQSLETLTKKLEVDGGICFVALVGEELAGTATVSFRKLHYWYCNGDVAIIKLVGVDQKYKGKHIGSMLIKKCLTEAGHHNRSVVVSDSAEHNKRIKHLYLSHGFLVTDYALYGKNNFYTTVYVKWLDGCPYVNMYRKLRYQLKRLYIRIKYKPGKINRFSGKQE